MKKKTFSLFTTHFQKLFKIIKNIFTTYSSDKIALTIDKLFYLNSKNPHKSHLQMGDRADSHFTA